MMHFFRVEAAILKIQQLCELARVREERRFADGSPYLHQHACVLNDNVLDLPSSMNSHLKLRK